MKMRLFVMAAVAAATLATLRGQQPSAGVQALDYYEIKQLYARFGHGLDTAEDNGAQFANVFTSDGVFVDAAGKRYEGREQLAAYARTDAGFPKGPSNVQHFTTDVAVDAVPGGARGHGVLLVVTPSGPAAAGRGPARAISDGGPYWDDLVRTPEGWRIKTRTLVHANGAAPALTSAGPSAAAAPVSMPHPFSAQDYADIDQLYALFGYAFDSAADQGYAWANLMTPDGIFVNGTVIGSMKGRDINAAFAYGSLQFTGGFASLARGPVPAKNPLGIQHILTDVMLEPTPDGGAAATVYRLNATIGANGQPNLAPGGLYHALLARTDEGWRFKENWYVNPNGPIPDGAKRFMPAHGPAAAVASVTAGQTPRASMPPLTLAPEDDAEIRQLYARVASAMDSGAENGNALAKLFTADGVLLDTWTNKVYAGRDQLATLARGTVADRKGATNVHEFIWTIKVEKAPQGVSSKSYMMTGTFQAPGQPILMTNGGQYWDDLVKTSDGWRIKKRTFYRTSQIPPPVAPAPAPTR